MKFTSIEIKRIKEIQESFNTSWIELGQIEYDISNFEKMKTKVTLELNKLHKEELKLSEELVEKYGVEQLEGVLDLNSGELSKK